MCDVILIYSIEPLCLAVNKRYSEKVILNSVTVTFSPFYNLFSAELYISITNSD